MSNDAAARSGAQSPIISTSDAVYSDRRCAKCRRQRWCVPHAAGTSKVQLSAKLDFRGICCSFPVSRENADGSDLTVSVITGSREQGVRTCSRNVPKIGTRANDREDLMNKLTVTAIALAAGFGAGAAWSQAPQQVKVSADALFPDAARE
jgi:hypothetical protein